MSCLRKIFEQKQIVSSNLVYVKQSRVIPWDSGKTKRQFVTLVDAQGYCCHGCITELYTGPVVNTMDRIEITNGCVSYSSYFQFWQNHQGIYIDDCVSKGQGALCEDKFIKPVYSVIPRPCAPVSCKIIDRMMKFANDGGLLKLPILQVVHRCTLDNTKVILHGLSDGFNVIAAKLDNNIPLYTTIKIHHWEKYPRNSIRVWDYELVGSERDGWHSDSQIITCHTKQSKQSTGVVPLVTPKCVGDIIRGDRFDQSPVVQVIAHDTYKDKCILLISDGSQYHGAVLSNKPDTYIELPKKGDVIVLNKYGMGRCGWWPTSQTICISSYSKLTTSAVQLDCPLYSCLGESNSCSQLTFGVLSRLCLQKSTRTEPIILQCIGKNDSKHALSDGEWFIECDIKNNINTFDFIQLNKYAITKDYINYCWVLTIDSMDKIDCGVDIVTKRRYHLPTDINKRWNEHFISLSGVDKTLRVHPSESNTLKVRVTRLTLGSKHFFNSLRAIVLDLIDNYGAQIGMEVISLFREKVDNNDIKVGSIIGITGFNYEHYRINAFIHLNDYPDAMLTANQETKIYVLPEDASYPMHKYTFVPLKQIPNRPSDALVDVCGVVTSMDSAGVIQIANPTTSIKIDTKSNQRNIDKNQIIILKNAGKLNACTLAFIKDSTSIYTSIEARDHYFDNKATREIESLVKWQQAGLPMNQVQPLTLQSAPRYVFV